MPRTGHSRGTESGLAGSGKVGLIRVHSCPSVAKILRLLREIFVSFRKPIGEATDGHGSEPDLTEAVIGSAFEIANVLGAGFLEKVYERALIREFDALRGIRAKAQVSFTVCYKG